MSDVKVKKLHNNKKITSLSFDTFQEVSEFIWSELKAMKKFNFSCSSKKNGSNIISYYKLKDENIVYIIKSKKSLLKRNMLIIGEVIGILLIFCIS